MNEKHFLFVVIILTFLLGSITDASSQNQVLINLQSLKQEFPVLKENFIATNNNFLLQANNQTSFKNLQLELSLSIKGNGIALTTNQNLANKNFELPAFATTILYANDLATYFDADNLDFSGFSKEDYKAGNPLPQGLYTICFDAKAYSSDAQYKPTSACTQLLLKVNDPPVILTPKNGVYVDVAKPFLFTWMPQHFSIGITEYEFSIYEDTGTSIADLINYYSPVYSIKTNMQSTLLDNTQRYLNKNTKYVCVVKVVSDENYSTPFKNDGYSKEVYFNTINKKAERFTAPPTECSYPKGKVFINEIANGGEYNNDEFVELVAVGSDVPGEYVNLKGYIIDDNNFDKAEVGNQHGHIRLGECFENVKKGTIILIYSEFYGYQHPNINPANDGYNPTTGVLQVPFTDPCIKSYKACPDHQADDTTYNCPETIERGWYYYWNQYIPMRNSQDVMQVRNTSHQLEHALMWVTHDFSYYNKYKVIFKDQNVSNTFLAFTKGNNWYDKENFTFGQYTSATPGLPNSQENEDLIDIIRNANGAQPNFSVSCTQVNNFYGARAKIDVTGSPGPFQVTINGQSFVTTANPIMSAPLSPGQYTINVQDTVTKCMDFCDVIITCATEGDLCNDYNDCTINDMYNADCVCIGEPSLNVTFDTISTIGLDSMCSYCFWYDTCEYSAYYINNFVYQLPTGIIDTLSSLDNALYGFNFPYCHDGISSSLIFPGCANNNTSVLQLVDDLNAFFALGIIQGSASFGEPIGCQSFRNANSNRSECDWYTGITITSNANFQFANTTYYYFDNSDIDIWDNPGFQFNCTNIGDSISLVANLDCENLTYLWSNGATTSSIPIDSSGACYSVTVTCVDGENNCSYVGTIGDNCNCTVGAPCDDGDPCTAGGYYDINCNCIEYTLTDSDGDGICDVEDECLGHDDNEDIDNDGIPDGCDEVQCDSLQVNIKVDTIYPGTCTYTVNIDSLLNGNDYVNIYQFKVGNEIVNTGYNLPLCYGPQGVSIEVANDDFENGWGFWGGFPPDANRINDSNYAASGTHSLRLRDDAEFSHIKSQVFAINGFSAVHINFAMKSNGFEDSNDKFVLEASFDAGNTYQTIKEWVYGIDFVNQVANTLEVNLPTNNTPHIKLRLRNMAHGDNKKVYFDNIIIQKIQNNCSINGTLNLLVGGIQQWLYDHNKSGVVSHSVSYNADTCDAPGHTIVITNTNITFQSLTGQYGNIFNQREFCMHLCQGSPSNDTLVEYTVITNCGDPNILWTNGSMADSLLIPINSNTEQTVTLTCGTCDTSIVVNEPNCIIGGLCTPAIFDSCFGFYLYDANCNCIGYAPQTQDDDNDGIYDCEDPCLNCPQNDSNGNGICDCLEPCPPIDSMTFIYTPITKEVCDLCLPLQNIQNQMLLGFKLAYPDSTVNITGSPFTFPYCTKYIGDECENDLPDLNDFTSTFYHWSVQRGENIVIKLNDSTCYNAPALRISNAPYKDIKFGFNNGAMNMERRNCRLDTIGYSVSVGSIANCEDPQYVWSNASTADTLFIRSMNTGFYLSVTCANGCEYSDSTNNTNCFYGAPCTNADPCTLGDTYDYNCNCIGSIKVPDSDMDGVCDSIDICNGFNDYFDYDGDGIPNGCDSCIIDSIRICDFCVNLPFNECISVNYIYYINQNGVLDSISFNSNIAIGPKCTNGNMQFLSQLSEWILANQYQGSPALNNVTCSGAKGFSLSISQSNIKFVSITFTNSTQQYIFNESNCQVNINSLAGKPCNDRDTCTIMDVFDSNCNCVGIFVDTDKDGVCDPLDKCKDFPDYIDTNANGRPDGCEDFYFYCSESDSLNFCDYFKKILECTDKFQPIDLIALQDTLLAWLQAESNSSIVKFNYPGLLEELMDIPKADLDKDGIINLLDICPYPNGENTPTFGTFFTLKSFGNCECDPAISNMKASLIANFLFQPGTYKLKDENGSVLYTPPCPSEVGLVETEEGFLVYQSDPRCYGTVEITCDCECKAVLLSDADKDGICDAKDTIIGKQCTLECPDTTICIVCRVVGNPAYHPTDNPGAEPCMFEYTILGDADGDGICDIKDDCPGEDDKADTDLDGIPNCIDPCPDSTFFDFALPGVDPPSGPGDPCDDHDPCTYGDSISFDCKCEGVRLDLDDDGVFDCGPCVIMQDTDGDGIGDTAIDLFSNFIDCDSCYTVDCDVCPGIPEGGDYNENGIPDCLDPPYYPIGCPGDFTIIPNEGLMLTFDSDKIKLEDIPQPISFTIMSQGTATTVNKYDYLTISYIREVNGTFEVLYGGNISGSADPLFASVSYADHQNCILSDSVENLVDIICPTNIAFVNGQLVLEVDYAGIDGLPDISKFEGQYIIDLTSSSSADSTLDFSANLGNIYTPTQSGTLFQLSMGVVNENVTNFANYSGSITLPNGTVCAYSNGTQDACTSGATGKPGDPCDDNNQCTHHDRIQLSNGVCECKGDPDPDIDNDGLCDKIDPCPDAENTSQDGPDDDNLPDCPCPTMTVAGDSLTGLNDYNVGLDMAGGGPLDNIIVTISGGPDGDYNDTLGTTMPLVVPNLPKGYPLTLTFVGQGSTGCVTNPLVVTVDVPFETDPAFCGISLSDFNIDNAALVTALLPDDVFKAYDFNVVVRNATGSNGRFTGKGFIEIPYFNLIRVNVKYKNIIITQKDNQKSLRSGYVEVTGFGQNVIGDDIIKGLDSLINILETVDDVLENIIDIVEDIEELVESTGALVDTSHVICIKRATFVLDSLSKVPNVSQAQINEAKENLETCKDNYKEALALAMDHILIVLNGNNSVEGILDQLSDCNDAGLFTTFLVDRKILKDKIDADSTNFVNALDDSGQGFSGWDLGDSMTVISTLDPTELDPDFKTKSEKYYNQEKEYQICKLMKKFQAEITSLENAKKVLSLILQAGQDFIPILGPEIKSNTNSQGIVQYGIVITKTKEAFKNILLELLIHEGYGK